MVGISQFINSPDDTFIVVKQPDTTTRATSTHGAIQFLVEDLGSSESSSSSKSGGSRLSRTKSKLSHLFCGAFTSKSTFREEMEDRPVISSISCAKGLAPIDAPQNSVSESFSVFTSEASRDVEQLPYQHFLNCVDLICEIYFELYYF
ncbi:hypothetical protein ACS0TY_019057 [Phlomoides rotata]